VPNTKINKEILISYPILHFHFLAEKRTQLKQAWYRCQELIKGDRNAKRINNTYRVTLSPKSIETFEVPPKWYTGLILPTKFDNLTNCWYFEEIKKLFEKYDVTFFEDLQIWHITELKIEFIKKNNREPQSKTYPNWLVFLNEIKNKIKCHF